MNDFDHVAFHPMQNDATTAISREDMKKIIELSKHKAEILDFAKMAEESATAPIVSTKPEKKSEAKKSEAK